MGGHSMRIGRRLRTLFLVGMLPLAAGLPTGAAADGGTVTSSPSGVSCPTTCSAAFDLGTEVTLTETPTSGWIFKAWGGACSGSASTCTLAINSAQNVSATFTDSPSLSVSVIGSPGGTVTSSPAGINCPTICTASFAVGTNVALTESPAGGWNFLQWDGACTGNGGCSVTLNANQSIMATFWTDGSTGPSSAAVASSAAPGPGSSTPTPP